MNHNILSLLGLALRGGRLDVGEEPVALAAKAGRARLILLASDAAGNTLRRAEHLAREGHCLWLAVPFPKAELGRALGRDTAAIAALTDTGLAAAVTERLAALDPERYGEAAARMDLKLRRARERRAAPRRAGKADRPLERERRPAGRDRPRSERPREDRPYHAGSSGARPQGGRPVRADGRRSPQHKGKPGPRPRSSGGPSRGGGR